MDVTKAVSILLIIATPICFLPQYVRIFRLRSSTGISISATAMYALVSNTQVATMWYLFRYTTNDNEFEMQDWLNMLQVVVGWGCWVVFLFMAIIFKPNKRTEEEVELNAVVKPIRQLLARTLILIFGFSLHAIVFFISSPHPDWSTTWHNIILMTNTLLIIPLLHICLAFAFLRQISVFRDHDWRKIALSKLSLGMQSLLFVALAVSWPFRLEQWEGEWCPVVEWAVISSGLFAVGQGTVLYHLCGTSETTDVMDDEKKPLLDFWT